MKFLSFFVFLSLLSLSSSSLLFNPFAITYVWFGEQVSQFQWEVIQVTRRTNDVILITDSKYVCGCFFHFNQIVRFTNLSSHTHTLSLTLSLTPLSPKRGDAIGLSELWVRERQKNIFDTVNLRFSISISAFLSFTLRLDKYKLGRFTRYNLTHYVTSDLLRFREVYQLWGWIEPWERRNSERYFILHEFMVKKGESESFEENKREREREIRTERERGRMLQKNPLITDILHTLYYLARPVHVRHSFSFLCGLGRRDPSADRQHSLSF